MAEINDLVAKKEESIDRGRSLLLAKETIFELGGVLGLLKKRESLLEEEHVGTLVEERNKARANKDWAKADLLREGLRGLGVILKDTPRGTRWKRARFLINDSTLSLRSEGD